MNRGGFSQPFKKLSRRTLRPIASEFDTASFFDFSTTDDESLLRMEIPIIYLGLNLSLSLYFGFIVGDEIPQFLPHKTQPTLRV